MPKLRILRGGRDHDETGIEERRGADSEENEEERKRTQLPRRETPREGQPLAKGEGTGKALPSPSVVASAILYTIF